MLPLFVSLLWSAVRPSDDAVAVAVSMAASADACHVVGSSYEYPKLAAPWHDGPVVDISMPCPHPGLNTMALTP